MTPTKIAVYDFDGTLFRSPEKPESWAEGWWGNPVSLNPPVVPEAPGVGWWNDSVVQRAKDDIANGDVFAVLLTGRLAKKFTARVKDLLAHAGLKFNRLYLAPGGDTEAYKLRVLGELISEFPTVTGVDIWEDRANHLAKFADFVESKGKAAFPHLITVSAQKPEGMPSATKVASLYLASGRVAARYKSKKKIETKDGDEATVYEYGPRQVANRHREKAERVEHLRKNITDLRARVKDDLTSDDPMTRMTALVISLMDHTCERVGNDDSADDGHYGVTGWLKKHITIRDGKATIKYVGKSGVRHEKTVDHGPTVTALKALCDGRDGGDAIFDTDDAKVSADEVNDYLAEFDVTAKDIRGFRANDEMCKALRAERAKGPKDLPRARKEKDEILKAEFKRALEHVAGVVGHEPATLRSQYLVPGLEDQYVHDGTVIKSLKVAASYSELPVSDENLPSQIRSFFTQHAWAFRKYPELWAKGGAARNALLSVLTDAPPTPPRDVDLVLIGESNPSVCEGIANELGLDRKDVECISSLSRYFSSRDLGVNEVLLRPGLVLFTEKARRDAMKGRASPSSGEFDPEYRDVSPRLALRGILIALREGLKIHPLLERSSLDARPFDLLIYLFKAFESGVEDRFFDAIRKSPLLRGVGSAEQALTHLLDQVYNFRLTDQQSRILQQIRREEEYGNRYATKSDAQREDEATEKLVKPAPKAKPPRHDLRNERVKAERDPDLDTTDDDLSLNFKKVARRVLVAGMAVRVAARYLWAKGDKPSEDDAEAEFLESVEGKLFKTPKSDKKEGVSYAHLKKVDPERASGVRKNWMKSRQKKVQGERQKEQKDQKGSEPSEAQKAQPATPEQIEQSVEKIQGSEAAKAMSEAERDSLSGLLSSVMSGQSVKDSKELEQSIYRHGATHVEKLKGGVDRKTVDALRKVPEGLYGKGVKMTTFDSKKSSDQIAKKQKSREKTKADYEQVKKSVKELPLEVADAEDSIESKNLDLQADTNRLKKLMGLTNASAIRKFLISETDSESRKNQITETPDNRLLELNRSDITRLKSKVSTATRAIEKLEATKAEAQNKLEVAERRLPSLEEAIERETSELNAMTAYHVSQEHLSSRLTEMPSGNSDPSKRLSDAARHLQSLPPEMADKAIERSKARRDEKKKELDNAPEDDREALQKELDLADAELAAGTHDKYLRMSQKEAEKDQKASVIRSLNDRGVGADDEHVQTLLREDATQSEVSKAVYNLADKMPDKDLLEVSDLGSAYDTLKDYPGVMRALRGVLVDNLASDIKKDRAKKTDKGKVAPAKGTTTRVEELAEASRDLPEKGRKTVEKVVRETATNLPAADRETVEDIIKLDIPTVGTPSKDEGGEGESDDKKPRKFKRKKSLMERAREFIQNMDIPPAERNKKLRGLSKMSPADIKAMMSAVMDEEEEVGGDAAKTAAFVRRAVMGSIATQIASRFLAYSTRTR